MARFAQPDRKHHNPIFYRETDDSEDDDENITTGLVRGSECLQY
jgi:hypothetical protein